MEGTEAYGDPEDDDQAWVKVYDSGDLADFTNFKVESLDKTISNVYKKEDLLDGNMKEEELLKDKFKI